MSDAKKTHTLTLGKHSEEVTDAELDATKKTLGRRFGEYTVAPIQPPKPADLKPSKVATTPPNPADVPA